MRSHLPILRKIEEDKLKNKELQVLPTVETIVVKESENKDLEIELTQQEKVEVESEIKQQEKMEVNSTSIPSDDNQKSKKKSTKK